MAAIGEGCGRAEGPWREEQGGSEGRKRGRWKVAQLRSRGAQRGERKGDEE